MVVSGGGSIRSWDSAFAFAPEAPPSNPTSSRALTLDDSDDLFLRLAGVPTASIPHPPAVASSCRPTFSFRLCDGCPVRTVDYDSPQQVLPEMESIWLWFDRILGASARTNPRNFCVGVKEQWHLPRCPLMAFSARRRGCESEDLTLPRPPDGSHFPAASAAAGWASGRWGNKQRFVNSSLKNSFRTGGQ